jgi:hypothetical protein
VNVTSHDPFDEPDAEDEADTRERVLEGGEDAGDADAPRVRHELGLDDEADEDWVPGPAPSMAGGRSERQVATGLDRLESGQPGFDEYGWDSAWASIEEDVGDDPDAAVSVFADLVERMLTASGYAVNDPVARQGEAPEIVRTYFAARDTAERAEVGLASRGDVEQAIEDLRSVFATISPDLGSR